MALKQNTQYDSVTYNEKTGCGTVSVICDHKNGKLRRVAIVLAQPGVCANTSMDSIAALINQMIIAVRTNIRATRLQKNERRKSIAKPLAVDYVIRALEGQKCSRSMCCYDVVASLLRKWRDEHEKIY